MAHSLQELEARISQGDRGGVAEALELLLPSLVRRAQSLLWKQPQGAEDAEDAALSALRTFVRRWQLGEYEQVKDVDSLFRLLATITCRKAIRQQQRRAQQTDAYAMLQPTSDGSHHPIGELLSVDATQEFDVLCKELLEVLPDDQHRQLVVLCVSGFTQQEIAEQLDCTDRNVRYKLKTVRSLWNRLLERGT